MGQKEIMKEILKNYFLELKKKKTQPTETSETQEKQFYKEQVTAVSVCIKNKIRAQRSDLIAPLKNLNNQEQTKPTRWQVDFIHKIRAEVNEIERRKTTQRINELEIWFFEKINRPFSSYWKERTGRPKLTESVTNRGTLQQVQI